MIIADVLSKVLNPGKNVDIPLQFTVDDILLDIDDENARKINMINATINKQVSL